jgi:hypothetical protein
LQTYNHTPLKKKKKKCKRKKKKKKKVNWKVYYSNETTISSEEATPFSIEKRDGVQVIVQGSEEHKWRTLSDYDYYMWDARGGDARWFGGDREGLSTYLRQPGHKCVLIGEFIDDKLFRKIFDKAREELGNKEAFTRDERHP